MNIENFIGSKVTNIVKLATPDGRIGYCIEFDNGTFFSPASEATIFSDSSGERVEDTLEYIDVNEYIASLGMG